MSDHFVHEAFKARDQSFGGIRGVSGAKRRVGVVLDDEFGKFTGSTPEGLLCDEQCCFETSDAGASREQVAIDDNAGATVNGFRRSQLGEDRERVVTGCGSLALEKAGCAQEQNSIADADHEACGATMFGHEDRSGSPAAASAPQ